jgi:hypothetical protein
MMNITDKGTDVVLGYVHTTTDQCGHVSVSCVASIGVVNHCEITELNGTVLASGPSGAKTSSVSLVNNTTTYMTGLGIIQSQPNNYWGKASTDVVIPVFS